MSILKARNRQPIINFGLGLTEGDVSETSEIVINQETIYLSSYDVQLETELSVVKVNNNKFIVSLNPFGTRGLKTIRVSVNGVILGNKVILNITA